MKKKSLEVGSRFIASTMHEVRTPLQTIISTLELLEETPLNREQIEYLKQIEFSASSLLGLANNVLDYTKISEANFVLDNKPFDPIELTEHVMDLIAIECFNRGIEVITDIDYSIPRDIMGDKARVQQIILNLVKNASKFTEHGFIMLRLSMRSRILVFEVIDSGCGVKEEEKELIFKDFYQTDSSITRSSTGTGLGLSICRNLVSIMGGRIGVLSNPSGGSNFWFTIPLELPAWSENQKNTAFNINKKHRILIADDNSFFKDALEKKLRFFGFTSIDKTDNGAKALEKIHFAQNTNNPYTLCFIDLFMPVMDGWKTAAEIRKFYGEKIKLILLVPEGQLKIEAKNRLLEWFTGYLYKPVKFNALKDILEKPDNAAGTSSSISKDIIGDIQIQSAVDEQVASGLKILVAEDQIVNQRLIATFLKKFGATVYLAENGEVAVNQIKAHPDIDIIFMDIFMPVKSGIDATIELRKMNYNGIIIACTANNNTDEFDTYREMGIQDIIVKPFKRNDIRILLEKWNSVLTIPNGKDIISISLIKDQVRKLWDIDDFMDTTDNNTEFAVSLMDEYVIQVEELMNNLKEEMDKSDNLKDYNKIELYAHTLKGSSASVSAIRFAELGRQMNDAAKAHDMARLEEARINFAIDFIELKAIIKNWEHSI